MSNRDVYSLYRELSEKFEEIKVILHDHDIVLDCEEDEYCNEELEDDDLRLLEILKEAQTIIDEKTR